MTWVGIGEGPPELERFFSGFASPGDGAILLFLGTVRDHNDGRAVRGLEYEAYQEMGEKVLAAIAREAELRFGTHRVGVYHRVGKLMVGEVSTVIAVATPHREEAYGASRYIIEELKKRLPVWKKEVYVEGDSRWVEGHVPRGDDAGGPGGPDSGSEGSGGQERHPGVEWGESQHGDPGE